MRTASFRWLQFFILGLAGWLMAACASMDNRVKAEIRNPGVASSGDVVQLLYAEKNVKEGFCPGSVVTVYRSAANAPPDAYHSKYEVGKVRVIRNLGDRLVEAEVVEGSVLPGDLALHPGSDRCPIRVSMLR